MDAIGCMQQLSLFAVRIDSIMLIQLVAYLQAFNGLLNEMVLISLRFTIFLQHISDMISVKEYPIPARPTLFLQLYFSNFRYLCLARRNQESKDSYVIGNM